MFLMWSMADKWVALQPPARQCSISEMGAGVAERGAWCSLWDWVCDTHQEEKGTSKRGSHHNVCLPHVWCWIKPDLHSKPLHFQGLMPSVFPLHFCFHAGEWILWHFCVLMWSTYLHFSFGLTLGVWKLISDCHKLATWSHRCREMLIQEEPAHSTALTADVFLHDLFINRFCIYLRTKDRILAYSPRSLL